MWISQVVGHLISKCLVLGSTGCAPQFESGYLYFEKIPWASDLPHLGPSVVNSDQPLVESFEDTLWKKKKIFK